MDPERSASRHFSIRASEIRGPEPRIQQDPVSGPYEVGTSAKMRFFTNSGSPLALPLLKDGHSQLLSEVTLSGGSILFIETDESSPTLIEGYASLEDLSGVEAHAILTSDVIRHDGINSGDGGDHYSLKIWASFYRLPSNDVTI